ncbi:hypothetical protein [Phenylobacterium sp.]|uniref:hypothetical protein n=1 Tax=Phenylobacterium sp. TaxID=1871053 RepID=UPI0035B49A4E
MTPIAPLVLSAAVLAAAPAEKPGDCPAIGVARLEADGAVVLRLTAEGPGGLHGDGMLRYAPSDPGYQAVREHIGPLKPGETVPVCPWPDEAAPPPARPAVKPDRR